MTKKKNARSASQMLQLQNARARNATLTLEKGLQAQVVASADCMKGKLEMAKAVNSDLSKQVEESARVIETLVDKLEHMTGLQKETYRALRNERRVRQRAIVRRDKLMEKLKDLEIEHHKDIHAFQAEKIAKENALSLLETNLKLKDTLLKNINSLSDELKNSHQTIKEAWAKFKQSQSQNYNL